MHVLTFFYIWNALVLTLVGIAVSWVYHHAAELRVALARYLLSKGLGASCDLDSAHISRDLALIQLNGVRMINPCAPVGSIKTWSHPNFAEAELVELGLEGGGLAGVLAIIGQWTFELLPGCHVAIGCARNRVGLLRVHGLTLNLEEIDGVSNLSTVWTDPPPDAPPPEKEKELRPPAAALHRAASSLGAGLREGLREGLAAAVGDEVSKAVVGAPYQDREREQQKGLFVDALRLCEQHISVGRVTVSAVTVHGVELTKGGKLRTLHCDGSWDVREYEGSRKKLGSMMVSGVLSRLISQKLSLTVSQAKRAAKEAEKSAKEAAKEAAREAKEAAREAAREAKEAAKLAVNEAANATIGARGTSMASNLIDQATSGMSREVQEAAADVKWAAESATSVAMNAVSASYTVAHAVESGTSRARASLFAGGSNLMGSLSLPVKRPSLSSLGLVGWSEANARRLPQKEGKPTANAAAVAAAATVAVPLTAPTATVTEAVEMATAAAVENAVEEAPTPTPVRTSTRG